MTEYEGLGYKDRFRRVMETVNSESAPAYSPETAIEPDGSSLIIYQWTAEEFTKLFSALSIGADLLWADEADAILWSLLKGVETPMAICDQVAECISSGALDSVLTEWMKNKNPVPIEGGGKILPETITNQNLLPQGWVCDDAHAFGMAQAIINYLDEEWKDVLALIEVTTNQVEALALLVDNNEATAIAGSALELATWLQDTVAENYDAKSTTQARLNLACSLYCKIKECELSLDDLIEWASQNSPVSTVILTLSDLALASIGLDANLSNEAFLSGCFWFVLQLQRLQSDNNLQFSFLSIAQIIALSADETSQDYVLCAECAECGYTVIEGVQGVSGVEQANTTLVTRLDGLGQGYAKQIVLDYTLAVNPISITWDLGGPDDNGLWVSDGVNSWQFTGVTGTQQITVMPSSTLTIQRGFSGSPNAYSGQTLIVEVEFC